MCMNTLAITIYGSMMGKLVNTREIRVMEGIYRRLGMKHQWISHPLFPIASLSILMDAVEVGPISGDKYPEVSLLAKVVFIPSFIKIHLLVKNTVQRKYFLLMDLGD